MTTINFEEIKEQICQYMQKKGECNDIECKQCEHNMALMIALIDRIRSVE